MPPEEITGLVESCISGLINPLEWQTLQRTEEMEGETLRKIFVKAA